MASPQILVARFDFDARIDNELSFRTGDRIILLEEHPSGMWKGQLQSTARIGYFPYNFVERETPGASAPAKGSQGITKEGWLHKEGHIRKNWCVRWCVLSNNQIQYFKSRSDPQPAGTIYLNEHSTVESSDKKQYCFCIHGQDKDLFVNFSSEVEMNEWRKAIEDAIKACTVH